AITDLGLEEPVAVLDAPLRFFVELWAAGAQPLEGLSLELQIDGQLVRSLPVSLEAGERARFTVIGTVGEPGVHHARATLRGDELEVDSVRDFAFEVREGVSVLVVDGEPGDEPWEGETDFLLAALAPEPGAHLQGDDIFAPRRITEAQLADEKLEGVDVIVLANVIAIGAEQAERIERWVREGGGLLFATGDQVDPRVWNELWWRDGKGPLPAQLGPTVRSPDEESYFVLEPLVFSHPALAPFAPREMRTLLTEPRWVAYTRLVPGEPAGDRTVLTRFAPRRLTEAGGLEASSTGRAQDPALVQRRVGRGEVVLYASALDAAWSNFYYKPGYVILWRRLLASLAAAGEPRRNLRVGEPFERTIAARDYVPEVTLITPDEDRVDKTLEPIDEARSEFRLVHEDTARPGFYRIEFRSRTAAATGERARKRGDGFAVHVDPRRESVLDAIDTDTLRTVLVPEVFEIRSLETAGAGPGAAVRGEAEGEISRGLLLAVMGLLFGESALGCWFGRRAAR
ncbi:MAG: hypothetical protein D6776_06660, partial [Planctomycetota bacterium]